MIKKVLGVLVLTGVLFSCGNNSQTKSDSSENEIAKVTVDQVMADLQSYVDKEVEVAGTVTHVCSHGGKRMFIIGDDPDAAIQITPNEEIGIFEKELEGSTVLVTGILKELRIDEAYVADLEKEVEQGADDVTLHNHAGGTHDEEAENEKNEQIEALRAQIAESGKGYFSQYWFEASKFEVKEYTENEADVEEHEHAEGEEHTH